MSKMRVVVVFEGDRRELRDFQRVLVDLGITGDNSLTKGKIDINGRLVIREKCRGAAKHLYRNLSAVMSPKAKVKMSLEWQSVEGSGSA